MSRAYPRSSAWIAIVFLAATSMAGSLVAIRRAAAVPLMLQYTDRDGEGFFDARLGEQRRAALELATAYWSATLAGDVVVVVEVSMDPLGGGGGSAILGSTRPATVHRNFEGVPPEVLYNAALANQLSNSDINGADIPEIVMVFNSDVDDNTVLGSASWDYGLEPHPGFDIDFVTVALHELGHGLGFSSQVDGSRGRLFFDVPSIFDTFLIWPRFGRFVDLRDAERYVAMRTPELHWDGPHVSAAHGAWPRLYTPPRFDGGSSVAHWDTALPELMAPFYQAPNRDPGLLLPAFVDMGWRLSATVTPPPSVPITPTPTTTPSHTASPVSTDTKPLAYVANFDDGTISVIDLGLRKVIDSVAVAEGPIDIAASSDGRYAYVAAFRAGELSTLATTSNTVIGSIALPGAPTAIAIRPDDAFAYVTLTDVDAVGVVDLRTGLPAALLSVGRNPAGIAIDPDGKSAFVTHFHASETHVIDLASNVTRAVLFPADSYRGVGMQGAVAEVPGQRIFATSFHSRSLEVFFREDLSVQSNLLVTEAAERPTAVAAAALRRRAYVASYEERNSAGHVTVFDTTIPTFFSQERTRLDTGLVPEALGLTGDETQLLVANAGSNSLTLFDLTQTRPARTTIPVGAAPMAVRVIDVPPLCFGDCDGDGSVEMAELHTATRMTLGSLPATPCRAVDRSADRIVSIDELVLAVRNVEAACRFTDRSIAALPAAQP